jgi:hypothetical protein
LYTRGKSVTAEENPAPETESIHAVRIPEAREAGRDRGPHPRHPRGLDAELGELAANLATTDDAHLFGQNEFKIRALAHKIAAKALEQHLARKKTATKAPE